MQANNIPTKINMQSSSNQSKKPNPASHDGRCHSTSPAQASHLLHLALIKYIGRPTLSQKYLYAQKL